MKVRLVTCATCFLLVAWSVDAAEKKRVYTDADLRFPLPPKSSPPSKETMEGLKARAYVAPVRYDGPVEIIAPYSVPARPAYLRPPPTRPTVVYVHPFYPSTYRRRY